MNHIKHERDSHFNHHRDLSSYYIRDMENIGDRIKRLRAAAGLSQAGLAKLAKVTTSTIGNLEAGTRKQPRSLLSIAAALGVSPQYLETGKNEPAKEWQPGEERQLTTQERGSFLKKLSNVYEQTEKLVREYEDLPTEFKELVDDALEQQAKLRALLNAARKTSDS